MFTYLIGPSPKSLERFPPAARAVRVDVELDMVIVARSSRVWDRFPTGCKDVRMAPAGTGSKMFALKGGREGLVPPLPSRPISPSHTLPLCPTLTLKKVQYHTISYDMMWYRKA